MTTPTDYRALCAELEHAAQELELAENALLCSSFHNSAIRAKAAAHRARAALAQPEPEALPAGYIDAEHTGHDRELLEVFYKACRSEGGTADEIHLRGLHAVLSRYARPAIEPVPVAERLPGPEDTTDRNECWYWHPGEECWETVPDFS